MWRLQLVGTHVLLVGATGAGKSAVLWAIIFGLAPLVRAGLVKVWVIDPKGGMELAAGRPLFDRFAYGDANHQPAATKPASPQLLEDAVAVMRRRADRLMRRHPPPHPHHRRAADRADHRRARRADRLDHRPHHARSGSTPPCRCCSPRAAPSASSSSGRCRTPART